MSKSYIAVKNGAVAMPSGFNSDFQNWSANHAQPTEEITNWTTGTYKWNRGTGVESSDISCSGFAFKGNGAGSSNPGFGVMAAAGGDTGGAATFTADTGCNIAGTYIVHGLSYQESRIQAAAKVSYQLCTGAADPVVSWAT